jgi:hypothetical protein
VLWLVLLPARLTYICNCLTHVVDTQSWALLKCLDPDARAVVGHTQLSQPEEHLDEHDATTRSTAAAVTPGGSAVKRRRLTPTMDYAYADTAVSLDDDATAEQLQEISSKDHWSSSITDNTAYDHIDEHTDNTVYDHIDEHADASRSEQHSAPTQSQRPSRPRMYASGSGGSSSSAPASGSFLSQEDFIQDNAVA